MDRRPHDDDPDDAPLEQEPREALRPEPVEPRPERRVRVERELCLEADEVLDRLEHGHVRAAEQQLPLEGRAVERATA